MHLCTEIFSTENSLWLEPRSSPPLALDSVTRQGTRLLSLRSHCIYGRGFSLSRDGKDLLLPPQAAGPPAAGRDSGCSFLASFQRGQSNLGRVGSLQRSASVTKGELRGQPVGQQREGPSPPCQLSPRWPGLQETGRMHLELICFHLYLLVCGHGIFGMPIWSTT